MKEIPRVATDPERAKLALLARIAKLTSDEYAARIAPKIRYVTRAQFEARMRT